MGSELPLHIVHLATTTISSSARCFVSWASNRAPLASMSSNDMQAGDPPTGDLPPANLPPANLQPTQPAPAAAPTVSSSTGLRLHACVSCQKRKVKCDRRDPCVHCTKMDIPCVASNPAPPRRRKRKTESDLLHRVKRCEDMLTTRDGGTNTPEDDDGGDNVTSHLPAEPLSEETYKGNLIVDNGHARFVDK